MLDTLQDLDSNLDLSLISKNDIIESITIDDIILFLQSLGVENIELHADKGYLICPTICHNPIDEAESMKLYWYQNHKIFHCYTECNDSMTIFQLYKKFIETNEHRQTTNEEAEEYVKHCIHHIIYHTHVNNNQYELDINKYKFQNHIPQLTPYSATILTYFTHYYHPLWLQEGINQKAMDDFFIRFSLGQNKIIIPHFDINGNLVGIRARTLDKKEAEAFGKYRPFQIGTTIYTHPLQFNLYGIYEHKNAIRKQRKAIIFEGEKSVLLHHGYYNQYSNAVACCGSSINKYHISLLTDILGVNDITIAFDKEYENCYDTEAKKYRNKIINICKRYTNQASFFYLWDFHDLLKKKDSPIDRGQQVFEKLLQERIKVI